jgi:bis(5'-nucleosidyl)-tetraphosphatase
MKHIESAGVVLYCQNDSTIEYLLLHYPTGHWDLPKGKIEAGETKHQAALRELKEETGLTATIGDGFEQSLHYNFTDFKGNQAHKTVYFFIARAHGTQVTLSDEHINYAWLNYEQALKKLTYENAQQILKNAHTFLMQNKS